MEPLRIATAQFENYSGNKEANLKIINNLATQASESGVNVIAFHECSIHGYTFARNLSKEQMLNLAEYIPEGPTIGKLQKIAKDNNIHILCGLFEKDKENNIYKAHVCVSKEGLVAKYRKLHPFINPNITPGDSYCIFKIKGWTCGILVCYDNNIIENVRATKLLGADIIFMPHVTMCTPSTRPGAGFVDAALWENRVNDPTSLRLEFEGMKGRQWLMKWLPARAYDNNIFAVFSNPIGMDDDQLKNGHSMIIDPYGDVLAECTSFDNEIAIATLNPEALTRAGGNRYIKARRPELYNKIIGQNHKSEQKVIWMK